MKLQKQNISLMNNRFFNLIRCLMFSILLLFLLSGMDARAQSVINYTYDGQGRLISETYENAYSQQFEYDEEGNLTSKTVSDTLMIPGEKTDVHFVVYPNPAENGFSINYALTNGDVPENFTLFNSNGEIIDVFPVKHATGVIRYKHSLQPGVYVLKAGKQMTRKIVIL
jgi:YD repeat-containing protein